MAGASMGGAEHGGGVRGGSMGGVRGDRWEAGSMRGGSGGIRGRMRIRGVETWGRIGAGPMREDVGGSPGGVFGKGYREGRGSMDQGSLWRGSIRGGSGGRIHGEESGRGVYRGK